MCGLERRIFSEVMEISPVQSGRSVQYSRIVGFRKRKTKKKKESICQGGEKKSKEKIYIEIKNLNIFYSSSTLTSTCFPRPHLTSCTNCSAHFFIFRKGV